MSELQNYPNPNTGRTSPSSPKEKPKEDDRPKEGGPPKEKPKEDDRPKEGGPPKEKPKEDERPKEGGPPKEAGPPNITDEKRKENLEKLRNRLLIKGGPGGPDGPPKEAPTKKSPIDTMLESTKIPTRPTIEGERKPEEKLDLEINKDGAEELYKHPVYLIVPSTFSYLFSVFVILILFIIYIISIGAISSFQSKFFPNIYMLWNFMTSGNTVQYMQEFEAYLKNVLITSQNDINSAGNVKDTFIGSKQYDSPEMIIRKQELKKDLAFMEKAKNSLFRFYENIKMMWNRFIVKMLVKGDRIKITRNI